MVQNTVQRTEKSVGEKEFDIITKAWPTSFKRGFRELDIWTKQDFINADMETITDMIKFDGIGNADIKTIQDMQTIFIELSPTEDDDLMRFDGDVKQMAEKMNELVDQLEDCKSDNLRLEKELKESKEIQLELIEERNMWKSVAEEKESALKRGSRLDADMITKLQDQLQALDKQLSEKKPTSEW